ncbi:MAG: hypothetical protein R3B91_18180 [Planctomycetaceae bacterium]
MPQPQEVDEILEYGGIVPGDIDVDRPTLGQQGQQAAEPQVVGGALLSLSLDLSLPGAAAGGIVHVAGIAAGE